MVLGRIFPKITKFYLDGSPAEAEIAYPDKVRRVHIRLGGQEEQITAGPEGVIYITKGYPSALQIKWALKLQKKKFLPYFKFFEAASLAYPDVSARLSQHVHHSALEGSYPVRYRIVRSSRRKNTQIINTNLIKQHCILFSKRSRNNGKCIGNSVLRILKGHLGYRT